LVVEFGFGEIALQEEKLIINFLKEWTVRYVRNKDIFEKQIIALKEFDKSFFVKYKTKSSLYVIEPFVENFSKLIQDSEALQQKHELVIVLFNTSKNLERTISEWKVLSQMKELKLLFVNPFSSTDIKWMVAPYIHNIVGEERSIARGLKSMFAMVEPLTDTGVGKIVKKGVKSN